MYKRLLMYPILLICIFTYGQVNMTDSDKWITVSDDEMVTISYNSNIVTNKSGNHVVWVKAVYHALEWQEYFARTIGSQILVKTTLTKAEYDDIYSYVRVRQVKCYSKSGKMIYDSGDGTSAGWGFVNASDPVGIVGEYLGK